MAGGPSGGHSTRIRINVPRCLPQETSTPASILPPSPASSPLTPVTTSSLETSPTSMVTSSSLTFAVTSPMLTSPSLTQAAISPASSPDSLDLSDISGLDTLLHTSLREQEVVTSPLSDTLASLVASLLTTFPSPPVVTRPYAKGIIIRYPSRQTE